MQDGLILVDVSYDNKKSPRITAEVAAALTGQVLDDKTRLKLAGTLLLAIVDEDLDTATGTNDCQVSTPAKKRQRLDSEQKGLDVEKSELAGLNALMGGELDLSSERSTDNIGKSSSSALDEGTEATTMKKGGSSEATASVGVAGGAVEIEAQAEDPDGPYTNSLSLLSDYFLMVAEHIKLSREQLKRDMEEVTNDEDKPSWDREKSGNKANLREFEAKLRLVKNKIARRLELTSEEGLPAPRLEVLCRVLGLDEFEKKVLVMLVGHTVSPIMKELVDKWGKSSAYDSGKGEVTVKTVLYAFCPTFREQVSKRSYFYKSSRMVWHMIMFFPPHAKSMDLSSDSHP